MIAAMLSWQVASAMTPEQQDELEGKVEEQLQEMVKFLVDPETFCTEHLGLPYEPQPPAKTLPELQVALDDMVQREAMLKYPDSQRGAFLREAEARFALYKVGDDVRLVRKTGDVIEGRLREIGEFWVLADVTRVRFDEMTEETLARFRPALATARVSNYVNEQMQRWQEERSQYTRRIYDQREHELFTKAGYLRQPGEWIPVKDYYERELAARRAELTETLRPMLRLQVYYKAGYRLYNGVWLTQAQINQREQLENLKREFPADFELVINALHEENLKAVSISSGGPAGGGPANKYD
jgi:hypothetical protein